MAKMMYVGADIDSKNITVCFIDELGKKLTKIRQWSNSPAGLEHLIQKSIQICSENEIEELITQVSHIVKYCKNNNNI